jgi:anti-sigma factor RsiW
MSERDNHPEQLLAGYADSTLSDREREDVERHLATCERCRDESALATRALGELKTIHEEPVPLGVTAPVRQEIARRAAAHRPRGVSERVVWAAVGAVAAVFVALLATTVLPNLGAGSADMTAGASSGAVAAAGAGAPEASTTRTAAAQKVTLETQDTNYDDATLATLAGRTASDAAQGFDANTGAHATSNQPTSLGGATTCVAKGADVEPQDRLVRLIRAKYEGTPAYIAVYLTVPPTGQQTKSVLVWVVGTQGCDFLQFTSKRI